MINELTNNPVEYLCSFGCCTMYVERYDTKNDSSLPTTEKCRKAGIFIHDPETDKILIVQSRGKRWGCPKGTIIEGESDKDCAVRETWEETGIRINKNDLTSALTIPGSKATYYYKDIKESRIIVPNINGNDVNGHSWIKLSCLRYMVDNRFIWITRDCRILMNFFAKNIENSVM